MSRLMVSVSGIRGEIGSTLSPETIHNFTAAFALFLKGGKVVVGRDSRVSGPFVTHIVKGVLMANGCDVVDIGIVPTPTVQMAVEYHKAAGGIAITASHNPVQWNGLKFIDSDGRFLSPDRAEEVFKLRDNKESNLVTWDELGAEAKDEEAVKRHIEAVLNISYLDVKALRKRHFKVAVDTVNGAGGEIIPALLKELGCEVFAINREMTGKFAHTPEPLPENLKQLGEAIRKSGADIGFAVDPDVDRCAIVDNNGNPLGEEYTLPIAVKLIFSKKMGRIAVNMSTSRASEDIAKYYNCMFVRSKVGEINVADKMKEIDAIIGGEGNGGVILPEVHTGRDAPVAIALTLQALLEFGGTIEELKNSLPQYVMVKNKVNIEGIDPDLILQKLAEKYKNEEINLLDGVKIDFEQSWVHLRKSNTEPILRIISEAPTIKEAQELAERFGKEALAISS